MLSFHVFPTTVYPCERRSAVNFFSIQARTAVTHWIELLVRFPAEADTVFPNYGRIFVAALVIFESLLHG
jgi:hypothetical protein